MTNEQKIRIASLRRSGCGYTAIARELGDPAIPTSEIAERFEFTDVFYFFEVNGGKYGILFSVP